MSNSNFNSFNQFDQFGNFLNNQGQFNYLNHDQDNAYNPFQNNNLNNTQSLASSNNNGYSTVNSAYPQTPLPPTPMNTLPNIPSTPMIPSTPLPFQTQTHTQPQQQQQQQNDLSSSSFQQPPATPAFQSNNYRQNNFTQPQFPHQTGFTRPNSPYSKNHNNNINNNFNDDDPDNLYSAPTPISAPTPMMPPLSPISAPTPMMAPLPLSAPTPQINYNSAANRQQLFNAPTPQPQLLSAPTPSTAMFNDPTPVSYEPPQTPSFDAPTPQQHYSQLSSTDFPSTPQVNFNAPMNYNSQPQFSNNVPAAFNAPTPYTVPTPYNQPQTPFSAPTPFNPPQTPYSAPTPYYNNNNNNSDNNSNVNYQQSSQFTNNSNEPQLPPSSLLQSTEGNQNSHHTSNNNKKNNNNDLFQNPIIPQTPMDFENEFKQPPSQYEFQAPSIPPLQRQYNSYQDDLYKVDSSNTSSEPISLNYNQQTQLQQQYQQPHPHPQPQQHQQRKQKPSKQHTKKPPVPQPPQTISKKPSPSIPPSHRQPQKTSAQPLAKPKETPIITPKPLNKMRKISMRSQNNSPTEGSNNPSMALSSNTKSFVIPEKTEKTTVFMSPIKKGRSLKLIDDNDDKDDLMVTTGEDRKVHQTNFEEAIRMATDNKINSVNSWNFALIDYFHDMNLLRENEGGSINFQKAGATLEGCMKIYSHRVDSVAVDTGKLLSGLGKKGEDEDSDNNDNDGIEDDSKNFNVDANGNHIITNGNVHSANGDPSHINHINHVDVSGNKKGKLKIPRKTLVEKFSTLQLRKFETELNIDPLFKKTLAEFDEGGTSALLLNSLHIDIDGRIVFDASTPSRGVGNNDQENPDSSKDKSSASDDDDEHMESDTVIDTIKDDGNDGILGGLAMESDLKDEAEGDDGEFEKFGNLKMLLNSSLNNDEIDIDDCAVCHSITELENVLKDTTKLKKFLQDINGTANITQDLSELNDGEESSDGLDEGDKLMEDKDVVLLDNLGTFDDFNDDIGLPDTINEEEEEEGEEGDRNSHQPNGKDTRDGTGSEADGMDNKYRSTSAEYLKEEDRELIDFFDKSSKKSWGGQKDSNGNWKVSQYKRKLGKLDSTEDGHNNNDSNENDDEENDNDGEDDEDEEFNGKKRKAKKGKKNGKIENNKKLKFQNDNDDAIIDFVNISYIPKDQLDKEMIEEETVLFARPKKPSAINMPMDSRISTESTILPEDMHYTSVKLTKTFIKPTLNIGLFTKKRKVNNSNKGLTLNKDGYKLKLNKGGIGFYDDNEDDEFDDDEDDNGDEGGEEGSNKSKKSNFIIDEKIWARKYEEKQELDEKNDNTKSEIKNGNGGDFFNDFDDGFHNNALYDDDDDDDDGEKIGTFDIPITQPVQVNDEVSNALDKIPVVVGTATTANKTSDPALSTSEGNVTARELNTAITNNVDKNGDSVKPSNDNAKTPTNNKEEKKVSFPVKPKVSFEFGRKQLSYAKKAKKINVKFLKDNLWKAVMRKEHIENIKLQREKQKNKIDLLSKSDTTNNTNKDKETEDKEGEFKEQFIETSLSELAKDVSKNYENKDKKELSTSFFFICMLHLANEHGLEIKNNGDYSDLTISKPEN